MPADHCEVKQRPDVERRRPLGPIAHANDHRLTRSEAEGRDRPRFSDHSARSPFEHAGPPTIDAGDGEPATSPLALPPVPPDAFLSWIFVHQQNTFLRVVARDVRLDDLPDRG